MSWSVEYGAMANRCDLQRLPPSNYLLLAFVQLWQIHSSSLFSLTALFTKIKDKRKHKLSVVWGHGCFPKVGCKEGLKGVQQA